MYKDVIPLSVPSFSPQKRSSRRHFLRASLVITTGGAVLTACGGSPTTTNVTLYTAGWPNDIPADKESQAKDPAQKAYAETLQGWMKQNPGVTLKKSTTDIWSQEVLTVAVSAGTAPSWYPGNVLGNWNDSNTRSAFLNGMAADVTAQIERLAISTKLAKYAQPLWSKWSVNDKYYAAPQYFGSGNGFYYRRDLIKQAGLQEPQQGWSWEDWHVLAKKLTEGNRKGAAIPSWACSQPLYVDGFDLLTKIPAPKKNWHWQYNYLSHAELWEQDITMYRTMLNVEKSLFTDAQANDAANSQAFVRGDVAMFWANSSYFTLPASSPTSLVNIATTLNKPLDEIVGWVSLPVGRTGMFGLTQPFITLISFNPRLSRDSAALDKSLSLYEYLHFGQGYIDQRVGIYQASKDLQKVYTEVPPINRIDKIQGIDGTAIDAWGANYIKAITDAANIALVPNEAWYFPPERNKGLTSEAEDDFISSASFSQRDVRELLQRRQDVENTQVASFSARVSSSDFTKAAKEYYSAHSDFWKEHAPDFYTTYYKPWYEQQAMPALK